MTEEENATARITCSVGKSVVTLTVTDEYLIQDSEDKRHSCRTHWRLEQLSPLVDTVYARKPVFTDAVLTVALCLGFAISQFHSSMNVEAHVLGAGLFVSGLLLCAFGLVFLLFSFRVRHLTRIASFHRKDGKYAARLAQTESNKEELDAFIETFSKAVKAAYERAGDEFPRSHALRGNAYRAARES